MCLMWRGRRRVKCPVPVFFNLLIMIEIILYKYSGKHNSLPKTLEEGTTLQGVLRELYNVSAPVVSVRTADLFTFNYCYLPIFGRYYFIEREDVTGTDTYNLHLSCDVLQTYSESILGSMGTVTQRDEPNTYVNDRSLKYDMRPKFQTVNFPSKGLFTRDGSIIMITIKGDK